VLDERLVPLLNALNDQGKWELWVPSKTGLVNIRSEPIEACYFARQVARNGDGYFSFLDLMYRHAFFPELKPVLRGVVDDLHNLAASLEKVNLLFEQWTRNNASVSRRFISTELEYTLATCKSLFDLLQWCTSTLWKRFRYLDPLKEKRALPKRFSKMVLYGQRVLTAKEIAERRCIPPDLASFYAKRAPFFQWVKDYRDYVSHRGGGFSIVFQTERGFAISTDTRPFSSMTIWNSDNTLPNNLGSVRSAMAHLILTTLTAFEEWTNCIAQIIQLPGDIAPGFHVFVRSAHSATLLDAKNYLRLKAWCEGIEKSGLKILF